MTTVDTDGADAVLETVVDLVPSWLSWVFNDHSGETANAGGDQATRSEIGMALRQAQIDYRRLRSGFNAMAAQVEAHRDNEVRLRRDIAIIGDSLREEALRRDWCSEYGDWIEGVNAQTSDQWLQHCTQTDTRSFVVEVTLTARNGYLNDGFASLASVLRSVEETEGLDYVEDFSVSVRPQQD